MTAFVTPVDGGSPIANLYDMAALGDALRDPVVHARVQEVMRQAGLVSDKPLARYKLEVFFSGDRSVWRPFRGAVMAWSNAGALHGGGDEKIYFCPQMVPRSNGEGERTCGHPLDLKFVTKNFAVCERCRRTTSPEDLIGEIMGNMSTQSWATLITRVFLLLDLSADIHITQFGRPIKPASDAELQRDLQGDLLNPIRRERFTVSYSLESIIKDTGQTGDVHTKIRALLSA